jgi:FkbM family methyltransferase
MLRKIISLLIRKSGTALINTAHSVYQEPKTQEQLLLAKWSADQGDKKLRLEYDLGQNSLVFDLGGYEGQWTSDLYSRYRCRIFVFEVHDEYADNISKRFHRNPDITVIPYGLAGKEGTETLYLNDNSSSLFRETGVQKEVRFREMKEFLEEQNISHVDLIKLSIEGGEYELLEHMLSSAIIEKFSNIQVRFHDFFPDSISRMEKIQEQLQQTHLLTYQYPFIWENWQLKKH